MKNNDIYVFIFNRLEDEGIKISLPKNYETFGIIMVTSESVIIKSNFSERNIYYREIDKICIEEGSVAIYQK